jgi:ParB-like chromosome segregation protein Spo0J
MGKTRDKRGEGADKDLPIAEKNGVARPEHDSPLPQEREVVGDPGKHVRGDPGQQPGGPAQRLEEAAPPNVVQIEPDKITVEEGNVHGVEELAGSIGQIGLLNPVTVRPDGDTGNFRLVAGRRRLAACKSLGWPTIPCNVRKLEDLTAELVAIDENLIRKTLTVLERAEALKRRQEIYQALHPQAVRPKGGRPKKNGEKNAPFSQDAAQKARVSPRTVQQELQIAGKLREETKRVIRGTDLEDRKADLLKLAAVESAEEQVTLARHLIQEVPRAEERVYKKFKRPGTSKTGTAGTNQAETQPTSGTPQGGQASEPADADAAPPSQTELAAARSEDARAEGELPPLEESTQESAPQPEGDARSKAGEIIQDIAHAENILRRTKDLFQDVSPRLDLAHRGRLINGVRAALERTRGVAQEFSDLLNSAQTPAGESTS